MKPLSKPWRPSLTVSGKVLLIALLMGGLLHGMPETVQAQHEGFMITDENAAIYQKIPEIENQLYGHAYPNQAISQRINRIERTIFGNRRSGPLEARMQEIESRMRSQKSKDTLAGQEPMLQYLEEKLFQRTFSNLPIQERIRQLETQVFGRSFDHYPVNVRMKKLTYAMPIMAREIRLSKPTTGGEGEMVIASTARTSQRTPRSGRPADVVQLDATTSNPHRALPNGVPLSTGDYFQSIHRNTDGSRLRWNNLPIKVYIKPSAEQIMTGQVIEAWQKGFSVEKVDSALDADVILTWDKADWDRNHSALLTRPVTHLDRHHHVRTIVLVTLFPLRGQPPLNQQHGLSHQLGHAFGLWGHSENPHDVMYPLLQQEANDFPAHWGWRSGSTGRGTPASGALAEGYLPSQRDFNTLLKIYDEPASDLARLEIR